LTAQIINKSVKFHRTCDDLPELRKKEKKDRQTDRLIPPLAPSDLQPHYGNGVFGNVYLLALDNTKR
jgi:hypothetical protein